MTKKRGFKKIGIQMMVCILPIIVIAILTLTVYSALSCKNMVRLQVGEKMKAILEVVFGLHHMHTIVSRNM